MRTWEIAGEPGGVSVNGLSCIAVTVCRKSVGSEICTSFFLSSCKNKKYFVLLCFYHAI